MTVSHPRFLEFLRPGNWCCVGVACRAGVPLANVLAIGDQFNDVEMITTAGHGAAMPHAPAPVRAVARYVAASLADEGAAQLIEQPVAASLAPPYPRAAAVEAEAARTRLLPGTGSATAAALSATA